MAAVAFNEAINARDIERLGELMTEDHVFVDSEGSEVSGKAAVLRAWKGFFESFPDYRNEWAEVHETERLTIAIGRSECASEPELHGPAIWSAKLHDGRVSEWRVYEDTAKNRAHLGIADADSR